MVRRPEAPPAMKHLTPAQLAELRQTLETERGRLVARLGREEAEVRGTGERDPTDEEEDAADLVMRSRAQTLAEMDRRQLSAIDAAIERMRIGTYGISIDSEDPIPFERLRAKPTALRTAEEVEELETAARRGDG
jgi:RNA polymerase-binding transcription factor DksA